MEDWLIPVTFFLVSATILVSLFYYRAKSRQSTMDTLTRLVEKGQTLTPELLEQILSGPTIVKDVVQRDMRKGILIGAVGLGLLAGGYFAGITIVFVAGIVLTFLGLGFWLSSQMLKKAQTETDT